MTAMRLPRIAHPLGSYWPQPANLRQRVAVFDTHATIPEADWLALPRYDRSTPSGVYPGKAWRRGKFLCWFGPERQQGCRVGHIRALVTGDPR